MSTRILYVDDEPDIREIAVLSLQLDAAFDVRACGSGSEALEIAAGWMPNLILLDVMMPGMDGPTTLARLRESAPVRHIPVVFVTARAQAREGDKFLAMGARGVISKPFAPLALAANVRTFLE